MDLLGSAIPGDVGLRLLLTPICSNIVIRTACCTVGTVLPVYSTFKSLERNDREDRDKWLVYWAVHGTFSLVEVFSDKLISWVPFYYHMKFAFLIWLQLPSNNRTVMLLLWQQFWWVWISERILLAGNRMQRVKPHYPVGQNDRRPLHSTQAGQWKSRWSHTCD